MSVGIWANIIMGITVLMAIAISHRSMLREIGEFRREASEPSTDQARANCGAIWADASTRRGKNWSGCVNGSAGSRVYWMPLG